MIVLYILLAIVVLLVMIIVHEFGHYLAGKILKFKINEFSVGFGPKIFSKKKKNGEVFSLRLIPLGGYCAFDGEDEVDSEKNEEPFPEETKPQEEQCEEQPRLKKFNEQPPWKRIIVLISGGMFNILSAIIFSLMYVAIVGAQIPVISSDLVADRLMEGDRIVAVEGVEVSVLHPFNEIFPAAEEGKAVTVTIERNGERKDVELVGSRFEMKDDKGNYIFENGEIKTEVKYGLQYGNTEFRKYGFFKTIGLSFPFTGKMIGAVFQSLWMLITGQVAITDVTGPIGTVTVIAEYTQINILNLFVFLPLISANLGVFNLLPIPALDGSKVVFCLIEWVRGKPIKPEIEAKIHTMGLFVLFGLVIALDIAGLIIRSLG